MTNTHYLKAELHSEFLKQGRIDPITGEEIEEGHTIVICSACKSAFFIESWEYLGQTHCNQAETLIEIPKPKNMFLKAKPLEYLPFLFKKGNRSIDDELRNSIASIIEGLSIILVLIFIPILFIYVSAILSIVVVFIMMVFIFNFLKDKPSKPIVKRKINSKNSIQIAINSKVQGITIKRSNETNVVKFDEIEELYYFVEYISDVDISDYDKCALSIRIKTSTKIGEGYYAILDIEELPRWSEFLEELPYSLKVLQVLREGK